MLTAGYEQINLVSDQAETALILDPNLVNPYGIALANGSGDAWVANAGSNTISRYIGAVSGSAFKTDSPTITSMPGTGPTGIVSNATGDFVVQIPGGGSGSAPFIFALQNGQIDVAPTLAASTATAGNNPATGAFYTGLALVNVNSSRFLYAANFAAGTISIFDNHFQTSGGAVSGAFQDPNLAGTGYSPYNVQVLSVGTTPFVFVTYAKQDPIDSHKIAADSKGIIDVYGLDGAFKGRLVSTTDVHLNAPWGLAIAPANFGDLANDLLVANRDGTIQAYSLTAGATAGAAPTAAFASTLNDTSGAAIHIDGLHGLAFGNNASAGDANKLFFSAGGSNGQHGLFGELVNAFQNPLTAQGTNFTTTEGTSFTGVVAAFTPEVARAAHTFTATIHWGDGTSSAGTIAANGSGGFNVTGTHVYNAPGGVSSASVAIVDTTTAGATATAPVTALVLEGNLTATAVAVSATEGAALTNVPVATFTDPSPGAAPASFSATIDWGDGTSASAGTVTGSNGTFTVSGSHTYAHQGTDNLTVRISEGVATPTPITVSGTASVANADVLTMTASAISATEASTFSGQVATFTDSFTATPASAFTATISWGDGTTTSGQVSGSNGTFTISGSHVYAVQGSPTVSVSVSENGSTASASGAAMASVADGDVFTPTGITLGTTAGVAFSGPVATFADNVTSTLAADLHATINWGDGTTDVGAVSGGSGAFTVSGSHTYASPGGPHQVSVVLGENAPLTASATAQSTALVFDPNLSGSPATLSATEATAIATGTTVATFTDSNLSAVAGDFSATINWGDGTSVTTAVVSGANGTFTVSGGHTYTNDGAFPVKVTLFEAATGIAPSLTIDSTANIAEAPLAVTVAPFGATEGSGGAFTNRQVATFTDANHTSLSSDFTATIDWGDGSAPSPGVITGGDGTFTVRGSHAYLDEGAKTLKVTVVEVPSTGNTASGTATATVIEGDQFPANIIASASATEGATFTGALATFVDQNTLATASSFTAIISWGDQTTTAGTVSGSNGTLTVSGSHIYAADGFFPLKVTLVDTGSGNAEANGTASVGEDAGYAATAATITGTEGQTFSGTVATFTDVGSTQPSSHYSATINWGDGTTATAGVVTGANGTFTVTGSHVYKDEGPFHPVVKIIEVNSPATISATGTATMADADVLTASGRNISPTRNVSFTGAVATFTDTFTDAAAGDFTATIDWGDGTSATSGTVTVVNGTFTVTGTHTYASPGAHPVKTVIKDIHGTASATASSTATPVSSTVSVTGVAVNVPTGLSVSSAKLATFVDASGAMPVANYSATINWGDGTSSAGTITLSGSTFTVTGSHAYTEPKIWHVSISVVPVSGAASAATSTATVGSETARFVAQVYHDVLSRRGEMQGIEYWTNRIDGGSARSNEVLNIQRSQEFRTNTIQALYRLLLHRPADAASLDFFNNFLISGYASGGHTPDQLGEILIASAEYFQSRGGGTASGFLNALYSDLVYHAPDAATASQWLAKNLNDPATRTQAAASVFGSDEYLNQLLSFTQPHASNAFADQVVHGLYEAYLHRDADAASLQYFLKLLKSGAHVDAVTAQIIGSTEYQSHV